MLYIVTTDSDWLTIKEEGLGTVKAYPMGSLLLAGTFGLLAGLLDGVLLKLHLPSGLQSQLFLLLTTKLRLQ